MQNINVVKQHLLAGFSSPDSDLIDQALSFCINLGKSTSIRPHGLDVAIILLDFKVDLNTLLATLLSDPRLSFTDQPTLISEKFSDTVAALVSNVNSLNKLNVYAEEMSQQPSQTETLRRMLLSMTKDLRAVLIKLAYRVQRLRIIENEHEALRHFICQETLDIYAPIANRLGINQLKWQLEDLSLRCLETEDYRYIAQSLADKRKHRQQYIADFINRCQKLLNGQDINAELSGRPKHIYSIWKKMQRKQLDIDKLYDLLAIRVVVDKIANCYAVLGTVHGHWQYVPKEFDDYIANPKENGYQSLHTVVLDEQGNRIEIQIRTQQMHEFSELGVAAHWRYKEGGKHNAATEQCIASLRQLLSDKDNEEQLIEGFKTELFADRVYVLSPAGKLVDLVKGSTPLDFAYSIHTELGHRCRGAKVNGRIVPLTYRLQSGEQIEVITVKKGDPNHNWMDPNLGYLKSPRAISKVKSWFKHEQYEQNIITGKTILNKACKHEGIETLDMALLLKNLRRSDPDKMLATIGQGSINKSRLANALKTPTAQATTSKAKSNQSIKKAIIMIDGIGNVKTSIAHCCEPKSSDAIIGYISHTRGITIHKYDCENIKHLSAQQQTQLISANWSE